MSEAIRKIVIDPTPNPTTFWLVTRHAVLWGYLVGAEAAAHLLFGGSWVVDLVVLVGLFGMLTGLSQKITGTSVGMSKPEIREWVAAGMPDDVKAWRESRKMRTVA